MDRPFASLLACLTVLVGLVALAIACLSRAGPPGDPRSGPDRARAAAGEPTEARVLFAARIDVNAATIDELASIPGIGPSRAERIVEAREGRGGRFDHLDDLLDVPGIGPRTHAKLVQFLRIGGGEP